MCLLFFFLPGKRLWQDEKTRGLEGFKKKKKPHKQHIWPIFIYVFWWKCMNYARQNFWWDQSKMWVCIFLPLFFVFGSSPFCLCFWWILYSVSVTKSLVAFRPDEKVSPLTASLFSRVALCTRTHWSSSSWQFGQLDFFLVEAWWTVSRKCILRSCLLWLVLGYH